MFNNILLVLDQSSSAAQLLPLVSKLVGTETDLTVIYILDAGWSEILGDEWLSNNVTRRTFLRYMEQQQSLEAKSQLDYLTKQLSKLVGKLRSQVVEGRPEKILVAAVKEQGPFDLIVIPHPRAGNGIKLKLDRLCKKITCPVLVAPLTKK